MPHSPLTLVSQEESGCEISKSVELQVCQLCEEERVRSLWLPLLHSKHCGTNGQRYILKNYFFFYLTLHYLRKKIPSNKSFSVKSHPLSFRKLTLMLATLLRRPYCQHTVIKKYRSDFQIIVLVTIPCMKYF